MSLRKIKIALRKDEMLQFLTTEEREFENSTINAAEQRISEVDPRPLADLEVQLIEPRFCLKIMSHVKISLN